MMIISGVAAALMAVILPETYTPVLLQKKVGLNLFLSKVYLVLILSFPQARQLRKSDPEKNANIYAANERTDFSLRGLLHRTLFRPFHMLFTEPILALTTIYLSFVYGLLYARKRGCL